MFRKVRRKMCFSFTLLLFISLSNALPKALDFPENINSNNDIDNDIIDFDDEYSLKYNKKYDSASWNTNDYNKDSYRYTIDKYSKDDQDKKKLNNKNNDTDSVSVTTESEDLSVIPIELITTTENESYVETTTQYDLTVIPLSSTDKATPLVLNDTLIFPMSTEKSEDYNNTTEFFELTTKSINSEPTTTSVSNSSTPIITESKLDNTTVSFTSESSTIISQNETDSNKTASTTTEIVDRDIESGELFEDVPVFTELDTEEQDVPEDYYDSKDIVPTPAPKTDALSVIFGFAGSVVEGVVESVAERLFPKTIYDLFKRMQKQNEALEAEKLRSREENGGIGHFTRGVIKSISTGLSKPFSQLMAGARDIGSLDSDRGFVSSLASGVTSVANVANSMVDMFKDRVQAIYPGTVWCGDGRSAQARSGDLGLFFFTDTCCRQHDACKLYIGAGETRFGLTNTGLFTRSHCSCDAKFRLCLKQTNSLVSAQIGLTYFNVLGPQCFRRAHPIVKCVRRTRITGQKCEEYELDYTKPKMWQWFDNDTF
ncbi:uncharacterized protein LOC119836992 [Zerene cesonia]|uniref:uncharacterized protein LOC119836992 n=1 Tax=Zerene cesonia TaxID=33412 RepID=UPI0018E59DA0|nr:uncharacterized protein LOC119836992 [Zerene cesonia]